MVGFSAFVEVRKHISGGGFKDGSALLLVLLEFWSYLCLIEARPKNFKQE